MIRALVAGARAARAGWVAALWLYGLGLVIALPVGLFAVDRVHRFFGARATGPDFAAGLSPLPAVDFLLDQQFILQSASPMIAGLLLLWALASPLLHGVAFAAASGASGSGALLASAGRTYGRLLRLAPMAWLLVGLAVGGLGAAAAYLGGSAIEDWTSEVGVFGVRILLVTVVALGVAWAKGATDVMRAIAVAEDEPSAWRAFLAGVARASRRPFALLGLVAGFVGLAWVITIAASLVDVQWSRTGWLALLIGLLFQQAIALARAFLRVGLSGAVVSGWSPGAAPAAAAPPRAP